MALSRSAIFSALSGNLPGVEVAMSKGRMIVKKRKPSKTMNSKAEQAARRAFTIWNRKWAALTADQVRAFNAYAATHPITDRLGASKYISGRNIFMRLRVPPSADYADFVETMPPIATTDPYFKGTTFLWAGGPYTILGWNNQSNVGNVVESIWVARFQSASTTHKPKTWIPVVTRERYPIDTTYYDAFIAAGIELCPGEHVALKHVMRAPDCWPCAPLIHWATVEPFIHAWYKMQDNLILSSVLDAKGPNPAQQLHGGVGHATNAHSVAGHIDLALSQNGVNDCIVFPEGAYVDQLGESKNFSICFWWKANAPDPATAKHFLSNYDAAGVGVAWLTRSDTYKTVIRALKDGHTVEDLHEWTKPVDADWHFFAMTRKGTAIKMFLDDIETHSVDAQYFDGACAEAGHPLSAGALMSVSHWAPGAIDDLRIYAHWLRDDEIAALAAM